MRWFDRTGQDPPDGLPDAARDYLEATRNPPDWVDRDVMEKARVFFIDNNVNIATALSFASMPTCYALPHVARLLTATHGLTYPSRRMAATGQFTVWLMRPDAFETGGQFIPAAQKVRLLHAAIRRDLKREGLWDSPGVPICQEDMIGAQMVFSIQVLDALDRLGIRVDEEGAAAYYYAWRVVGAMLGCDQAAAPTDLTSAREYSDLYLLRHLGASEEGAALTRALIDLYEQVVPGTFFDPLVPALIRYLIGDTIADWLKVPRSHWDGPVKAVPVFSRLLLSLEDLDPRLRWLGDQLGRVTTNLELSSLTKGRVMPYTLPEDPEAPQLR
jgi:ER-bound oxygenase mpaB/B'/Rubber oxygenase, catalytic domain